jgi:hypothetical protein
MGCSQKLKMNIYMAQQHSMDFDSMKTRSAMIYLFLIAVGLALGWWIRGNVAQDTCLDAGGKWVTGGGYCHGTQFGLIQS